MNLFKKNYFLTLFLGLSFIFILANVVFITQSTEEDYQITIEHGDSLWALADKYGTDEQKEAWINQVMKLNNLHTAHIKVGDVLIIPNAAERVHFNHTTELAGNN